jgi:hypothetical protein
MVKRDEFRPTIFYNRSESALVRESRMGSVGMKGDGYRSGEESSR